MNHGPPEPAAMHRSPAVHRGDAACKVFCHVAPEASEARFAGNWFLTGDQGVMDAHGAVTYLGRKDDMMNAGGFRVSPLEVEAVLNTHPGITQAAVTDIEVKRDARLIMAFYTAPAPLDAEALADWTRERLAGYKCPRGFYHIEALPTGANGKLLRRALRPIFEAHHGQA
jgi:acyl-coenzyme A synthetase/AMP-(fatty) acid ligase